MATHSSTGIGTRNFVTCFFINGRSSVHNLLNVLTVIRKFSRHQLSPKCPLLAASQKPFVLFLHQTERRGSSKALEIKSLKMIYIFSYNRNLTQVHSHTHTHTHTCPHPLHTQYTIHRGGCTRVKRISLHHYSVCIKLLRLLTGSGLDILIYVRWVVCNFLCHTHTYPHLPHGTHTHKTFMYIVYT